MLEPNISNSTLSYRNDINTSLNNSDQTLKNDNSINHINYSKKLVSKDYQISTYSNTLTITDFSYIDKQNQKNIEQKFSNNFEIFKEKFENFLRFEDIPIEYVSPIEKEFVKFLKMEKVQTVNLVGQWIIDSFHDSKKLLNIVKILGNIANDVC